MGRRIDVDGALPAVAIPSRVLHELYRVARDACPEECCGLIVGGPGERHRRVVPCENVMNQKHEADPGRFPLDNRSGFWMRETDYLKARDEAARAGEEITAVYHSHVGEGVYLSPLDLEYAEHAFFPFPAADQIVIAVVEEGPERRIAGAGIFRRSREQGVFSGYPLEAAP